MTDKIGSFSCENKSFDDIDELFENTFKNENFLELCSQQRFTEVCKALYQLIDKTPADAKTSTNQMNS